jgi:predicted methyltransferase
MRTGIFGILTCVALGSLGLAASPACSAADIYTAAVQHAGRSPEDLERDKLEHPADILRVSGIKPGMQVIDVLAGGGYYSELLSYVVGPKGHVLLLNNAAYDHWSTDSGGWQKRLADNRLPNVEHHTADLEHLDLPDHSADALVLIKVYHERRPRPTRARTQAGRHSLDRGSLRQTRHWQRRCLQPPPHRRSLYREGLRKARLQTGWQE